MSKGEERIAELLQEAGISFTREKSFSDLKCGLFRYDFYIPDFEGGRAIIEYNGEQHYHYIAKFYQSQRDWRKMQEHDRRKISYALANKIALYAIPFWELKNITVASQLFSPQFKAKTRWKNDEDARISPLNQKKSRY